MLEGGLVEGDVDAASPLVAFDVLGDLVEVMLEPTLLTLIEADQGGQALFSLELTYLLIETVDLGTDVVLHLITLLATVHPLVGILLSDLRY